MIHDQTYAVCGVPILATSAEGAAGRIVEAAASGRRLQVHLCNAYTLSLVDEDERLSAALIQSDMNLPDGSPVAWLGRRQGVRVPVRGPHLLRSVAAAGIPFGLKHYFYGGAPNVADELAAVLLRAHEGLRVAGTESPAYRDPDLEDLRRTAARVLDAGSHVVWVGLGTPRQDYVVPALSELTNMPVVPVGAAFDFLTGRVREAPGVLHGTGLEWMHRFASEPRRLWRRYLLGNPKFVASAVRHQLRG